MTTIQLAKEARIQVLKMVHRANASHIGGAYSMTDILAVLYNDILNMTPSTRNDPDRDRFFLSKGHSCAALYAVLALKDFFPIEELDTYAEDGSRFISHVSHYIPGVEASSGSLGHILSIACGVAYAAKLNNKRFNVYCLISDGELDEGSNWEPILFAPQHKLNNLILIVDYNKIQSLGNVRDILDLEPLASKFEAFGWQVHEVDGHNTTELEASLRLISVHKTDKPHVVVAHTIKGKGVDFMENKLLWHYRAPNKELFEEAMKQLNA